MDHGTHESLKLVIAGPVGAGKTTAIRSMADVEPISTEMDLTEGPMGEKTTTTVALDFSTIMLEDGTPLMVYGLPGQERFSHMRPIVIQGAVGVVVVLDSGSAELPAACEAWLSSVRQIEADMPIVIGVTKTDHHPDFDLGRVREAVRRCGPPVPVFSFDARDKDQCLHLVRGLLVTLE